MRPVLSLIHIYAVVLLRAEVLPGKGGDGNTVRAQYHPEEAVHLAVRRPGPVSYTHLDVYKRQTYDNILRLVDDPDVIAPIRFLRERERCV